VALGPKPRKYDQKTPKKMIKAALNSALSDRAAEGKVVVVEQWGFEAPKTKDAKAALNALGIDGKALVVVDIDDTNTIRSFLNLQEVQLIEASELNAYDVLCNDYVVFSQKTLPGTAVAGNEPVTTRAPITAPANKSAAKKAPAKAAAMPGAKTAAKKAPAKALAKKAVASKSTAKAPAKKAGGSK
jgi:large subunit ribosomal protein L4